MAQEATENASSKAKDASRTWKSRFVSRITAPYFGAAVCAAAVMAWYLDFVPGKLDYFVGLRFRTLAVARVVARLISKGLVVTTPGLSVFNFTFRRFLRGIERNQIVTEWEHMEGTGLWVTAGRLVGSSMILGGLFFFLTQDFPVQSLLPIVSGTGLFSLPLVRDLVSRLAGGRSGGGTQNA